jgi:hypothetical protein
MSYEAVKKRAEPCTKILEELPEMRRDIVELVRRAITENRNVYALVNNRADGNAPINKTPKAPRDTSRAHCTGRQRRIEKGMEASQGGVL